MPITQAAAVTALGETVATLTIAGVAVAATANPMIRVQIHLENETVSATRVTWNGIDLRRIARAVAANEALELWTQTVLMPATGSVVITLDGSCDVVGAAIVAYGIDQVRSVGPVTIATGSSTTPGVTVNTDPDVPFAYTVAFGAVAASNNALGTRALTVGAGQTQQYNTKTAAPALNAVLGAGSTRTPASAAQAMGWTLGPTGTWAMIGAALNPYEYSARGRIAVLENEVARIGSYRRPDWFFLNP